MDYELQGGRHELSRAYNPWDNFRTRNENNHKAEDTSRLFPSSQPDPTSSQVIDTFLKHKSHRLNKLVLRRWQLLEDFLNEVVRESLPGTRSYIDDVDSYVPNITSGCALVLAATIAQRSASPVRGFLHRYLGREHVFIASTTSWGFFLEFHIPYHAMREIDATDPRTIFKKPLRKGGTLPLKKFANIKEDLYYHEAQTSSLSWGNDEWFWTEIFLVDTYFGSEENRREYFANYDEGDGFDPPLGGQSSLKKKPHYDPREYFLRKLDVRIAQTAIEYSTLVETFTERMEAYAESIKDHFEDDKVMTHTRTIGHVIETIQIFVGCISGIVEAWASFRYTGLALFCQHAPEKLSWPPIISNIAGNIAELDRLRKTLTRRRELFKFKLESFHTVSSLSQTESTIKQANVANTQADRAVSQGEDLKTLTQMTVYIAFPLLFTTAFFSMDFADPPAYPWAVFIGVLCGVFIINYMIASQSSPWQTYIDFVTWFRVYSGRMRRWVRRP
ncbi:hypothetical protein FB567DRAFT_601211 [Paraphoma chrysanthemicola]|uniref:Uncharacterized protein n=1 Tax=Paraphoma chrysanthemicola TaxID=798071 RepID=A0A8K0RJ00_9PLEO|nr:hypothetical protein FB567DRAFT_601211 [Paraphoma chrysanthemicola]